MSKLKFGDRWFRYTPSWLGNREQAGPFQLEFRRLTVAELEAFAEAWKTARFDDARGGVFSGSELAELFNGKVRGPFGELEIDGTVIAEGNLDALLELAAKENAWIDGTLLVELAQRLQAVNSLSNEAEGKSERRPGGSGTSSVQAAGAAASPSVPPPAAPDAEPSSPATPESTS